MRSSGVPLLCSRHYARRHLCPPRQSGARWLSVDASTFDATADAVRRSWLYVPCSSDHKLRKSLTSGSDMVIYDLEDSVSPSPIDKGNARKRLSAFLSNPQLEGRRDRARVAVRLNAVDTPFFEHDIKVALRHPNDIGTFVMPKVHSADDLARVEDAVSQAVGADAAPARPPLNIIASIESARALFDVGTIAAWKPSGAVGAHIQLSGLLFAAEDYCADTSIVRTRTREELLYTRSRIVNAAKAFGLDAIDMVCVNYKDAEYLQEECEDGRNLGFTGKQAIHPAQVEIIQRAFAPSPAEILRAAKIVHAMAQAHAAEIGAVGLDDGNGGMEMIDAPMLKQAEKIIRIARSAHLDIPAVA